MTQPSERSKDALSIRNFDKLHLEWLFSFKFYSIYVNDPASPTTLATSKLVKSDSKTIISIHNFI